MEVAEAGQSFDVRDVTRGVHSGRGQARPPARAPGGGGPPMAGVGGVRAWVPANPRASLGCCCLFALALLVLLLVSLGSLQPTEYGLKYNRVNKEIDKSQTYHGGRHFIGPLTSFLVFPAIVKNLEFSDRGSASAPPLNTNTNDGLSLQLHVAFQYQLIQDKVGKLCTLANTNYEPLYLKIARDVLLKVAGSYNAEGYWKSREAIGQDMFAQVDASLKESYARCTGLQVMKIDLPASKEEALVKTQVATQGVQTRQCEQQATLIRAETGVIVADKQRNVTVTLATAQANAQLAVKSAEAKAAQMRIDAENDALGHVQEQLKLKPEYLVGYQRGFSYQTIPNATFLFGVPNAVAVVGAAPGQSAGQAPAPPGLEACARPAAAGAGALASGSAWSA